LWIGTFNSRGIDRIEIVGSLGSTRTSSISLEWGSTGAVVVCRRSSFPTSSSVCGSPRWVGASTFAASFTGLFCSSASVSLLTSLSAIAAVAPPDSATTPAAATATRHASHQRLRGGSGGVL
jgi:hypothetical protein